MTDERLTPSDPVVPISLLFVIGSLGRGGAERQMALLAAGLQSRGHRVAIMLLDDEGDLAAEAEEEGIDLIRLYERRHLWSAPKVIRFIRGVRRFSPEVVHSYLPKDNARLAVVRRFVRPARIVWGIRASKMDWRKYGLRQTLLWPLVTRLSKRADLIIANSWSGAQYHIDLGYPADRVTVIPNGIDTERFRPDEEGGLRFRVEHGIPVGAKVVGMLARFDPIKGQTQFPEILQKVLESRPDAFGVIVGAHSETEKREVLDRASEIGVDQKLKIVGSTPAPWDVLNAFDVLVLPSVTESFPNVVGEALACNVPVASYDVGDVKQLLNGLYEVVPQGEVTALADTALGLLEPKTLEASRSAVISNYSVESLINASESQLIGVLQTQRLIINPSINDLSNCEAPGISPPIKLLLFITSLGGGGAERQMVLLARELTAMGHDVTIAVLSPGGQHYDSARALGLKLVVLKRRGDLGLLALAALLRRGHFDAAYSFLPESNAKIAAVRWVRPSTKIAWGVRASNIDLSRYDLRSRIAWQAARFLSCCPDLILANSHAGASFHVSKGYPRKKITVVQNGIDTDEFFSDPDAGSQFRNEHDIPDDAKVIGMMGRFDPMKGHNHFLKVAATVAKEFPNLVPVIVGVQSTSEALELQAEAEKSGLGGSLRVIGRTEEPKAALNAFDVLVVPSVFGEGFPNVVVEALACGTPVAAFDVGDIALILNGVCDVAGVGETQELTELVRLALRATTSPNAQNYVSFYTDPGVMARKTLQAILLP